MPEWTAQQREVIESPARTIVCSAAAGSGKTAVMIARIVRMLREGADSTYEAWGRDAKWNTSLFHLCYTYPVLFLCDWGMENRPAAE